MAEVPGMPKSMSDESDESAVETDDSSDPDYTLKTIERKHGKHQTRPQPATHRTRATTTLTIPLSSVDPEALTRVGPMDIEQAPSTVPEEEAETHQAKFMQFEDVLSHLETSGGVLRLEDRERRYMWGLMNSGDLPTLPRNKADGDRWDAFCPGYPVLDTKKTYNVTSILGIMFVDDQNHKIAVRLDERGYDDDIAQKEIALYSAIYEKNVRPNTYVPYPECMKPTANPYVDIDLCLVCGGEFGDKEHGPMLLCDKKISPLKTCNHTMHMRCAGLDKVPSGKWFCTDCVAVKGPSNILTDWRDRLEEARDERELTVVERDMLKAIRKTQKTAKRKRL